ncbi:MAG: RNA polymerase sigma-70 factor [Marinifilaceae bacterium]
MSKQKKTLFTKKSFDALFREYYNDLCRFAYTFLRDEHLCDDIVQEVFIHLWERRTSLKEIQSFKSYLFRAVRNKCIDSLRRDMRHSIVSMENENVRELSFYDYSLESMEKEDLKNNIEDAIGNLPRNCRNIFVLSREAKLTYADIAEELDISKKTVENQIGIAIKKIRKHLRHAGLISLIVSFACSLLFFK